MRTILTLGILFLESILSQVNAYPTCDDCATLTNSFNFMALCSTYGFSDDQCGINASGALDACNSELNCHNQQRRTPMVPHPSKK